MAIQLLYMCMCMCMCGTYSVNYVACACACACALRTQIIQCAHTALCNLCICHYSVYSLTTQYTLYVLCANQYRAVLS